MATLETIIVGAGPYGLSIAAHLRAAGIDHAVVGRPMESWRRYMPARMVLKSECFASDLSDPDKRYSLPRFFAARGLPYARAGAPLSLADFVDYADWFQRQAVPDIWDTTLRDLRWNGQAFELAFDDRTVTAKRVIVATGHMAFRHLPELLTAASPEVRAQVSHSADHRDFAGFAGRDVTVIGRGQSGLETAALLHEEGAHVRVLARARTIEWNPDLEERPSLARRLRSPESAIGGGWHSLFYSEYPRVFHKVPPAKRRELVTKAHIPAGAWWLKRRVAGKLPLLTSHQLAAIDARAGKLHLTVRNGHGDEHIATDHVIAATGYKIDLDRVPFLASPLRGAIKTADGAPVLNAVFESSVPHLHFVGLASMNSFGPVMRFVYGARHAAAILGRHLGASRSLQA
jgi:cation diffusion facilitator CzcD-associated flavoprotein CzcO